MSKEEWAAMIERGIRRHELARARSRRKVLRHLRHFLPVPILIGLVASVLYVRVWGWASFLQALLSWVVGITLVTTLLAIFVPGKKS